MFEFLVLAMWGVKLVRCRVPSFEIKFLDNYMMCWMQLSVNRTAHS
jgi:hypothetical protein